MENDDRFEYLIDLLHKINPDVQCGFSLFTFVEVADDEELTEGLISYLEKNPDATEEDVDVWLYGDDTHEAHVTDPQVEWFN